MIRTVEVDVPGDYTQEQIAAAIALKACYEYWTLYNERRAEEGDYNNAVIWLQDNDTGHMLIFTRGEYSDRLKVLLDDLFAELEKYPF